MHSLSVLGLWGVLDAVGYLQLRVCKPSAFNSPSLPIGPRRAFKHAPTQDLCDEQHFLLFAAGVFSAPRPTLFQKGLPYVAHFFSLLQAGSCLCHIPCHYRGGSTECRRAHGSEVVFQLYVDLLLLFCAFLPWFLLLCAFGVCEFCVSLRCVCQSYIFAWAWIAQHRVQSVIQSVMLSVMLSVI